LEHAIELLGKAETSGPHSREAVEALDFVGNLWNVFIQDLVDPENDLPNFSAFPTVLLVATLLRLALNIATTRLILSHGPEGLMAAGYIIGGFSKLVMSGDFVIGLIVFAILITVNFVVITRARHASPK
jgi:flagellar biosynthesis component FlhA